MIAGLGGRHGQMCRHCSPRVPYPRDGCFPTLARHMAPLRTMAPRDTVPVSPGHITEEKACCPPLPMSLPTGWEMKTVRSHRPQAGVGAYMEVAGPTVSLALLPYGKEPCARPGSPVHRHSANSCWAQGLCWISLESACTEMRTETQPQLHDKAPGDLLYMEAGQPGCRRARGKGWGPF